MPTATDRITALINKGNDRFNKRVDRQLAPSTARLKRDYASVRAAVKPSIDALRKEAETATRDQLRQSPVIVTLKAEARQRLTTFAKTIQGEAARQERDGVTNGVSLAMDTLNDTMPNPIKPDVQSIRTLIARVGGAFFAAMLADWVGRQIGQIDTFFQTAETGSNSANWIVKAIDGFFKTSILSSAIGAVETIGLDAAREAARRTYERNGVREWIWSCAKDRKTCASCWAMHGQRFPITQSLNDHPSGRCAMVPVTRSWADLGLDGQDVTVRDGEYYFRKLSTAAQREILGPSRYRAWQAGEFEFTSLSTESTITGVGTVRVARSLRSLVGDSVASQYIQQTRQGVQ